MSKEKYHLITASLISSVKWSLRAPETLIPENRGGGGETWRSKAELDLRRMVSRDWSGFSEEAQNGVAFESSIYAGGDKSGLYSGQDYEYVLQALSGYDFRFKKGFSENVLGVMSYLYGKFDAVDHKAKKIIDLKTTNSYSEGKYLDTFQHKLYAYITKYPYFEYLIVEWDKYPVIKNIHREVFQVEHWDRLKDEVHTEIWNTLEILKDLNLYDLYREKYCKY